MRRKKSTPLKDSVPVAYLLRSVLMPNGFQVNIVERLLRNALKIQEAASVKLAKAPEGSAEEKAASEFAKGAWQSFGLHFWAFCNLDNPGKLLREIADASEGKFPAAKYDVQIMEAYEKAVRTGKRLDERSLNVFPFFSEVDNALAILSGTSRVPTKRALRRRLKKLQLSLSKKPGRPRKRPFRE